MTCKCYVCDVIVEVNDEDVPCPECRNYNSLYEVLYYAEDKR